MKTYFNILVDCIKLSRIALQRINQIWNLVGCMQWTMLSGSGSSSRSGNDGSIEGNELKSHPLDLWILLKL